MKIKAALLGSSFCFLVAGNAQASLIDRDGGLIYDDDLNITWQQRPSSLWTTWVSANQWATNLNYFDSARDVTWSDWRLPSHGELSHLYLEELGGQRGFDIRYPPSDNYLLFNNIQPYQYWTSTLYAVNSAEYVNVFNFYLGQEYSLNKFNQYGLTWAVMNGDVGAVSSVPAPPAWSTMLAGLIAIAIYWRRSSAHPG